MFQRIDRDWLVGNVNTARSKQQQAITPKAQPASASLDAVEDGALCLRPFGSHQGDLDLNFASDDRPSLVTRVLAACLARPGATAIEVEELWNLTVSRRIQYLLQLAFGDQAQSAKLTLRCPQNDCRQVLEVELQVQEVLDPQRRVQDHEWLPWPDGGRPLRFRRPTGNDQRRWRAEKFANPDSARIAMIRSLLVNDEQPTQTTEETTFHPSENCTPQRPSGSWTRPSRNLILSLPSTYAPVARIARERLNLPWIWRYWHWTNWNECSGRCCTMSIDWRRGTAGERRKFSLLARHAARVT